MKLQIPTVTESDLLTFHTQRFGAPFRYNTLMPDVSASTTYYEEEAYDDDDSLGYYPDGTKRTLTPTQIALFRHTEIETLLREKREREEAARDTQNSHTSVSPAPAASKPASSRRPQSTPAAGTAADSDEEEYTRFLAAERAEFQKAAARKRNGDREGFGYEAGDRTISTRRRVRELDSVGGGGDVGVLMYDDEPVETSAAGGRKMDEEKVGEKKEEKEEKREGRRIWFPMIG